MSSTEYGHKWSLRKTWPQEKVPDFLLNLLWSLTGLHRMLRIRGIQSINAIKFFTAENFPFTYVVGWWWHSLPMELGTEFKGRALKLWDTGNLWHARQFRVACSGAKHRGGTLGKKNFKVLDLNHVTHGFGGYWQSPKISPYFSVFWKCHLMSVIGVLSNSHLIPLLDGLVGWVRKSRSLDPWWQQSLLIFKCMYNMFSMPS